MFQSAESPPDGISDDPGGWLRLARDAYKTSTDYYEANIQRRVAEGIAHFQNRHAPGSKYLSEQFKFRPKGFRPKTRAIIRRGEASAAIAFFSTQDAVYVAPEDDSDDQNKLAAMLVSNLINYRLEHSIQWFLTLVGAYQDAMTVGVCISRQYWRYETESDSIDGAAVERLLEDRPCVDLIPIENFRFSASADWRNPCASSPYLIELLPYYVGELKALETTTGAIKWKPIKEEWLSAASGQREDETTRQARLGNRIDPTKESHETNAFDIIWVHRNIIRDEGEDWIYYTLGTQHLLSEPVPLRKVYQHLRRGERDYVIGFSVLETHKAYPDGVAGITSQLQREANDVGNQRRENVNLVLNKRYYARRGARIDWRRLQQNVPGGVVEMDDINSDIKWDSPPDVTSSAYEEQNRINVDFDELSGAFSAGSVATNRQMNETVGGMNLLQGDANVIQEYQLRVFTETWVEPVLRQLVSMEQAYETDDRLLMMAAGKEQSRSIRVFPDMLQGALSVRVNVGFGATKPEQRLQKIVLGLDTLMKYRPDQIGQMDFGEVAKEVLGALGYKGVERFFPALNGPAPEIQQLQQQVQALQQELQQKTQEIALRNEGAKEVELMRSETELEKQARDQAFQYEMKQAELARGLSGSFESGTARN